jgi:catechol 2,3-dioxygenase-like lactoylglutathione lyase family enzyme
MNPAGCNRLKDMTERDPTLEPFDALIGTWATESTHPLFDEVVPGSVSYEWLEGGHFLVQRSRNEHELLPDAIWVIGVAEDHDGLLLEYFDSRGVRRTYDGSLDSGLLRIWGGFPEFDQRFSATLGSDAFEGQWQLARTPGDWQDDLKVVCRRREVSSPHLFAGLRVRDVQAARQWYERLLGEPTFFPHDTEAVWTLAEERSVYVVEHPDGAGSSVVTIFLDDLDARVAAIAARGLEPDERATYANGVRKIVYRDPDGNELGFGGAPLDTGSSA